MTKRWTGGIGLAGAISALAGQAAAGDGVIRSDGTVELSVNVRLVPTQEDLDELREQFERAQLSLCSATDGFVRLSKVTVTRRQADEKRADIWWYPEIESEFGGRSFVSGRIGEVESKFVLFGSAESASSLSETLKKSETRPRYFNLRGLFGTTISHELGHYILNIGDLYPEADRDGQGCGWGHGIEPALFGPESNSLMQLPLQVCVNQDGQTHTDFDPGLASVLCSNDAFCAQLNTATSTWSCLPHPFGRELSVATNYETLLAPWADGSSSVPAACPGPRPPTDLHLHARIYDILGSDDATYPVGDFDPEDEETYNVTKKWAAFDSTGNQATFETYVVKYESLATGSADKLMLIVTTDSALYSTPPAAGVKTELARYALELDASGLIAINGTPVVDGVALDGSRPILELGGMSPRPFGTEIDGAVGQHSATSPLTSGAAPIALNLHLENMRVQSYESQFVSSGVRELGNSAFFVSHPFTNVVGSRLVAAGELPQQRGCADPNWCAALYNPTTGDFNGSAPH